jgi:small-conductance mechanosensitive channel
VNHNNARGYRQVGSSPPDPKLMGKAEIEQRRETLTRLRDLLKQTEKGDEKVVPTIREILDQSPDLAWSFRNLGKMTERLLINEMTGEDLLAKEMIEHQLHCMRSEIAGEHPSPLELLLTERIVATWLQVQLFESHYACGLGKHTLAQGNYYQKRLDRAHRNHLSAMRTLAQIRKLGPAAVQINIAEKQINTSG